MGMRGMSVQPICSGMLCRSLSVSTLMLEAAAASGTDPQTRRAGSVISDADASRGAAQVLSADVEAHKCGETDPFEDMELPQGASAASIAYRCSAATARARWNGPRNKCSSFRISQGQ